MDTTNSKTNEPHRVRLSLADKFHLKDPHKIMALANLNFYYTWSAIKSVYINNKFIRPAPTWNDDYDLLMDYIVLY